ncbi:hypothetical protein [Paraburkholderia kururiensis]|uniref:hypothetical protein n=2 Tax=Paraburkholderia TaxID=1822464 RepID=UPI003B7D41BB
MNGARARAAGLRRIALRSAAALAVLTVAGCAAYPYNTYGTYDSSYYGGAVDNGYYYAPYGPATVYDNGPVYYGPGYGGWYGDRGYWRDGDRDWGHGSWGDRGRPPQDPRPMPGHRPPGGGPRARDRRLPQRRPHRRQRLLRLRHRHRHRRGLAAVTAAVAVAGEEPGAARNGARAAAGIDGP